MMKIMKLAVFAVMACAVFAGTASADESTTETARTKRVLVERIETTAADGTVTVDERWERRTYQGEARQIPGFEDPVPPAGQLRTMQEQERRQVTTINPDGTRQNSTVIISRPVCTTGFYGSQVPCHYR